MSKRRVLALLLALSLVVSGNGMTVLAAEQGADMPVLASQEVLPETVPEEQEDISDSMASEPAIEDKSEEMAPSTEEEPSTDVDETEEGKASEIPDEDVGDQTGDQSSAEEDGNGGQEEVPGVEEPEPVIDGEETTVSGNEAEETEEPETEKPEEDTFQVQSYVSRMVTFTDDTGMRVTYDANASQQYSYVVENGVLTGVNQTVSENTVEPVAFEGNVELRQPETGEQYTSVAPGVFGGNTKVTYVKLPAGLTSVAAESFKGCTGLKGVYLPPTVTEIGVSAFETCTAMTQISVPKAVTSIGDSAFKGDTRLHLVYIKDVDYSELTTIGEEAFEGCTVLSEFCADTYFAIPNKVESIGASAFKGCKAIRTVDFKDTKLEMLGTSAFEGCTKLESLSMGTKLTLISMRAFADCGALASVTFPVVGDVNCTIDEYAFSGCYNIKQLVLPQFVNKVNANAFQGCTKLTRVEIRCDTIELVKESFPLENKGLVIVATPGSKGDDYAARYAKQVDKDQLYTYAVEDIDGTEVKDGKFPGGTLWVGTAEKNKYEENINTLNKGKGVKSDDTKYYVYQSAKEDYTFIADSLKCNGQPMQRENGKYYFTMPEGGVVITAEFRANKLDKISGQKVAVEFSAGVPLQNGQQDDYGYLGVELKQGQITRLFVLDEDGESIPAAKLKLSSQKNDVVTINSKGVITAVGTGSGESASAAIEIKVVGGDGKDIVFTRTINVKTAEAKSIILKASGYKESQVDVESGKSGIQIASINKNIVKADDLKFSLKANVYDGEDAIGKKLQWTSSDSRVAVLASASTEAKDSSNEVIVKKNCEGEATIAVTAKNAEGAEQDKIVQKFVVRVYQEGYRLTSSSVTINPNETRGGTVELLSTSGGDIGEASIKLYEAGSMSNTRFTVAEAEQSGGSESSYKKFYIKPDTTNIKNGTYKVRVGVNGNRNEDEFLPLTITVKRTTPTPTIKFNSKRTKFNLFYKNGGVDTKGNQTVVTTEITKLGNAKIGKVVLEPLTQKEDDKLFVENFEIDNALTNLSEGKVVIKRKDGNLKYTSKKKAAVTGNLVIYYEGYEDSAAKKVKVTMPTCTTAPSYALRTAKATYRDSYFANETLELYDKKSKTKEQVVLVQGRDTVEVKDAGEGSVIVNIHPEIQADGTIAVGFVAEKGKLKLAISNPGWDLDKNGDRRELSFTYTVNVSSGKPTLKTDQSTVTLNSNYPERAATFQLVSNQKGVDIGQSQNFEAASDKEGIQNLEVTYENGVGTVKIKDGRRVEKGTYKFACEFPQSADWPDLKKVTLTVKVVDNKPTVKFGKGSLQLNRRVYMDNSLSANSVDETGNPLYREIASIPFTVNSIPEGYTIADVGTGNQATEIKTQSGGSVDKRFSFQIKKGNPEEKISDMLEVSLSDSALSAGTYKFTMTQRYLKDGNTTVTAKPVNFSVKVSDKAVELSVSAKGKINLVNRKGEASEKNGILYTPTLKNISGEITDAKILEAEASGGWKESERFEAQLISEGKNKGKIYVAPKVIKQPGADGISTTEKYAELDNNANYAVRIWVKVKGYAGTDQTMNGVMSTIRIKTAQVLPKVTTDKSTLDVYLSTKGYDAAFTVKPKDGSVGEIEAIYFGEKDDKAKDSFEMIPEPQTDGSMKVTIHLQEAVGFANGSTNDVKMYVKYKGQGMNTKVDATSFTMKIKVN